MAPRRRTITSNFGVSTRESHDARPFYDRFRPPAVSTDDSVAAPAPVAEPFVHGDARHMDAVADGSVALVVTSPPYFAGKQYEEELEREGVPTVLLTRRHISVMDRQQSTPKAQPELPIAGLVPAPVGLLFHQDEPRDQFAYYFKPLARLWLEYRRTQVMAYLSQFARQAQAAGACLKPDRFYSHQILPFANPGWDPSKYAVGEDLAVPADVQLGISLYGEASYGSSFFEWFARTRRQAYGVTEFHPMRAMDPAELRTLLERHQAHHARFVSFFMESEGLAEDPGSKPNPHSFNVLNKDFGSDVLYRSVQQVMRPAAAAGTQP